MNPYVLCLVNFIAFKLVSQLSEITCDELEAPSTAFLQCTRGFTYGSECTLIPKPGYTMEGLSKFSCGEFGGWSAVLDLGSIRGIMPKLYHTWQLCITFNFAAFWTPLPATPAVVQGQTLLGTEVGLPLQLIGVRFYLRVQLATRHLVTHLAWVSRQESGYPWHHNTTKFFYVAAGTVASRWRKATS